MVAVSENQAEKFGYRVGKSFPMTFQAGAQELEVAVIFAAGGVPGDFILSPDTLEKRGPVLLDALVFVNLADNAHYDAVRKDIEEITQTQPTVNEEEPGGFAELTTAQDNKLHNRIY